MVTNQRRRIILTALGLYIFAALFIGYFGVNAFTGAHGLRAQADLDHRLVVMQKELGPLKARCGSGGCRCCAQTASTPTCWMSGPACCWAMSTRAT